MMLFTVRISESLTVRSSSLEPCGPASTEGRIATGGTSNRSMIRFSGRPSQADMSRSCSSLSGMARSSLRMRSGLRSSCALASSGRSSAPVDSGFS